MDDSAREKLIQTAMKTAMDDARSSSFLYC